MTSPNVPSSTAVRRRPPVVVIAAAAITGLKSAVGSFGLVFTALGLSDAEVAGLRASATNWQQSLKGSIDPPARDSR